MPYGFAGSVSSFRDMVRQGDFAVKLSSTRIETGGHKLASVEQNIWNDIAGHIADILCSSELDTDKTYILVEYDIPGHLGRCDLVLIGAGFDGHKSGLVVELKKWPRVDALETPDYVQLGGRLHIHPAVQVLGYRDKLVYFHGESADYEMHANVWFLDLDPRDLACLTEQASLNAKLWSLVRNRTEIRAYLKTLFGKGLSDDHFQKFVGSGYHQNSLLALELNKRLPIITKGISRALGTPPHDLTQEQQSVVEIIGNEAKGEGNKLIIISGEPGSGKTIVGLTAMIEQLARNDQSKVVLALRNNRLCPVVRSAIDDAGLGVGSALVQYVKGGGPNVGIWYEVKHAQKNGSSLPIYDLIVIDEAHRVPHKNPRGDQNALSQLEAVLLAGKVVVCLLDEGQLLNEDDNGTNEIIKKIWANKFPNSQIVELVLDDQHRLPIEYHTWLVGLFNEKKQQLSANYDFRVVSRPDDVIAYLSEKKHDADCGLLASYTYSDGHNGNRLRVPSPPINWLMTPTEHNNWWRNRNIRHQFTYCASVYGCQGFDLDYAGVFWGKDLVVRENKGAIVFRINEQHDIKDDIGRAFGRSLRTLANMAINDRAINDRVIQMLINRYRILLSRGRKGTIVCCEDEETARVLRSMCSS